MGKKTGTVLLIAAFIGWFSYRFFNRPALRPPAASSMNLDWGSLEQSSEPQTLQKIPPRSTPKTRVHESLGPEEQAKFAVFDQMEEMWLTKVQAMLDSKQYAIYLDMREQNEKEKLEAYQEYHNYLRKKHGDQFSYKISEDQSAAEKAVNQKYLKELLKLIGEEKFAQYLRARDEVNEVLRRNNKPFIQVEF